MSSIKRRHTLLEISPNKLDSAKKRIRGHINPIKCSISLNFEQENLNCLLDDENSFMFANTYEEDDIFLQNFADNENSSRGSLNLESWQRCKVDDVQRDPKQYDWILQLSHELDTEQKAQCRLQGAWLNTKVDKGDTVSVKAVWDAKNKCFVVTNNEGIIVTNPDQLVSGTAVAGSLFCPRKSVLQERFRGIDSDSNAMTIGSIAHELFQLVLKRKLKTAEQIKQACDEVLQSESSMFMLYSCKVNANQMMAELLPFVSNIKDFVEQYIIGSNKQKGSKGEFTGIIESVQDIEENLWVPQLGLKGKIDVSVRVKPHANSYKSDIKYMPLELKTGRASFSNEHKGQLIMYEMMLDELGRKVDSGLLLYLRENIMKEVHGSKNSKRDIIILRNELSYYLTRKLPVNDPERIKEILANYRAMLLPEPINHYNACSKCPYNTTCCLYLSQDKSADAGNDAIGRISAECMSHLQPEDIEYFTHWCGLLTLEDQEMKSANNVRSLWTKTPEQRKDMGQAIINLKIVEKILTVENTYLHTFESSDDEVLSSQSAIYCDFTLSGINPGDYVIVSTHRRIAIATGHVDNITKTRISIHLERNLSTNYQNEQFIVDKHISQSTNTFNFTNLGVLLEDRRESNKLRKIIISKVKPTFSDHIVLPTAAQNIFADLNKNQKKAILMALKMNDYMLLKGLPGTGKTQTLVALIRILCLKQKTVIVTSHTHSAVDNILQRLQRHNISFLRLGSNSRIHPSLHDYSEAKLTESCKTPRDLTSVYNSHKIVALTCQGSSHSIFLHRRFDYCIVDEATQVLQPTVIRPLFYADKFILVGDPDQLPPVVKSKLARKIGASESLFQRLDSPDGTTVLSTQYRMNRTVTKLANGLTYKGNLICADESVSNRTLDLPNKPTMFNEFRRNKWLFRTLEKHVDLSVIMLDTKDCLQRSRDFENSLSIGLSDIIEKTFSEEPRNPKGFKFTYTNYCDAAVAFYLVRSLIIGGCSANNIGIIAPYRAQVELMRKIYEDSVNFYSSPKIDSLKRIDFQGLEINTVDQYQGRDKDVIIYSCTRTGNSGAETSIRGRGVEILEDQRRLTVAITRSKCKLIIIGDGECLKGYTPFRDLLEKIPSRCKIMLEDDVMGFSWDEVFQELRKILL